MSKRQSLMLIGVCIVVLAIPGFPYWLRTGLLIIAGLILVILGYKMEGPTIVDETKDMPFSDYKRPEPPAPAPSAPVQEQKIEEPAPETPAQPTTTNEDSHEGIVG